MDHDTAIQIKAAEQYWIGRLSTEERDQFEEHFFGCEECAEEVRWEKIFAANARSAFRDDQQFVPGQNRLGKSTESTRSRWLAWLDWFRFQPALLAFSAGANVALLLATGFLGARLSQLSSPQFYPAYFLPSISRGVEGAVQVPKGSKFLGVRFDIPEGQAESYECEILGQSGSELTAPVPAPADPNSGLNLIIPVYKLNAGEHTVVLRGRKTGRQIEIARSTFTIP